MIKTKKTGQLIVISGPSGAGKDSIVEKLLKIQDNLWLSVSATSRNPRGNEVNGKEYYFLTRKEFEEKIKDNYFIEYAEYAENYYGTPKKYIKEKLDKGIDVILVIEIQGASIIKNVFDNAIFIFIMPPSIKELLYRIKKRGSDSDDKIIKRFHKTYNEINEVSKYNYVVVNDDLDVATNKVKSIINAEKCRVDRIEEVFLDTKEEEIHELLINKEFNNDKLSNKLEKL